MSNNCEKHSVPCGCKDTGIVTPPPCGDGIECPDSNPCSETFDAGCIFYTGEPILCGTDEVVPANTSVADAVAAVVSYFCTQDGVDDDIVCGVDTVVAAGTSINDALDQIVAYVCGQLIDGMSTTFGDIVDLDGCTSRTWTINLLSGATTIATVNFSTPAICPPTTTLGLFSQTANSAVVSDPGSGSIIGAGVGSLTLPNTLQVGDSYRAKLAGRITCSNTQEFTISLQFNGGTIVTSLPPVPLKSTVNGYWNMDIDFTVRSLGPGGVANGEVVAAGTWTYNADGTTPNMEGVNFSNVINMDTTTFNPIDILGSWNLPEAGANTIYSELCTLTKTY